MNHPNRKPYDLALPPPDRVQAARQAAGLTQPEAAALVHVSIDTWARWESAGDRRRQMPLMAWELFQRKVRTAKPMTEAERAGWLRGSDRVKGSR